MSRNRFFTTIILVALMVHFASAQMRMRRRSTPKIPRSKSRSFQGPRRSSVKVPRLSINTPKRNIPRSKKLSQGSSPFPPRSRKTSKNTSPFPPRNFPKNGPPFPPLSKKPGKNPLFQGGKPPKIASPLNVDKVFAGFSSNFRQRIKSRIGKLQLPNVADIIQQIRQRGKIPFPKPGEIPPITEIVNLAEALMYCNCCMNFV